MGSGGCWERRGAGGGREVDPTPRHPGKGSLRLLVLTPRERGGLCQAKWGGHPGRGVAHERPERKNQPGEGAG